MKKDAKSEAAANNLNGWCKVIAEMGERARCEERMRKQRAAQVIENIMANEVPIERVYMSLLALDCGMINVDEFFRTVRTTVEEVHPKEG